MPIDLNAKRIDPHDAQFETMLRNLQGNILKGHGRVHSVSVFLGLHADASVAARFGAFAAALVTSALKQRDETDQFNTHRVPGGLFGNVYLSANGYRKLGFTEDQLTAAFVETPNPFGAGQSNFREGMQAHGDELNDPPPPSWEPGYRDGKIDVMIQIADDDQAFLMRQANQILSDVSGFADVLVVEHGDVLRNSQGDGIEHFGFVDGRSQPIYFVTDLPGEGTIQKWDPSEPLGRVLIPDPNTTEPDSFGSYVVYRKLEQDVLHFKTRERELADALGLVGSDRARAGAMAVGRFEDGTPLALSQTDGFTPHQENDFQYDVDPTGAKCPFHAHIRKTNPRGDIVRQFGAPEETAERSRRITRRAIPYGTRATLPSDPQSLQDLPSTGVGLLFVCFQASIANQFAFMQRSWVDTESFVVDRTGVDPVIGQVPSGGPAPGKQQWPNQWGQAGTVTSFSFGQFVTLKGGEFFFAPSIAFLKSLAAPARGTSTLG
jgi:Dyp-type peroxidase family